MSIKYFLIIALLSIFVQAEDKLKIGGSSTLFLFSSTVSSILGVMKNQDLPLIESTGSSKGIKQLCLKSSKNSLDIANASRRIKKKEVLKCAQNGVKDISELYVGRNGIVFVQNKNSNSFPNITRRELFLALAQEVPDKNNKLVKNPHKYWNEINPKLPKRKILVYGHNKTAGIRASFNAIIKHISKKSKDLSLIYKNKGYSNYITLRNDGIFIELDSDEKILEETLKNKNAIGTLNYLYYSKNTKESMGISIDGVLPSIENINNSSYKLAKKLYIYYRKSKKANNHSIEEYLTAFLSDEAIGEDGILKEIGFVPLSKKQRDLTRSIYKNNLTLQYR